jgi:hypothetical protein
MSRRARRRKEPPVDPDVQEMFDTIWNAFLEIAEEEVVYPLSAPLTTERVLEKVETLMYDELEEGLREKLTFVLCDACYCVPQHFLNYIFYGDLPSRVDLENCMYEYLDAINEGREPWDIFVKQVEELYRCFLLLDRFFDALPDLLEVKVVEGDIVPDICYDRSAMQEAVQNTSWYVGLRATGSYGDPRIEEHYYGLGDGRVMVIRLGLGGYWCDEGFESEVLPKLTNRLKEVSGRPDLTIGVYGNPPVNLKSISPSLTPIKIVAPPRL